MPKRAKRYKVRAKDNKPAYSSLYHDRRYKRNREAYLTAHPICEVCNKAVATELHHKIRHKGDAALFWSVSNWQGVCRACHEMLTAAERAGD